MTLKVGFIPTEGGRAYRDSLEELEFGERLGFDSVWVEEHHGVKEHYWPSPLTVLAGFASRSSRLMLGTNIAILPLYNPVRLAEDAALVDIMSGGRLVLGVAIGYRPQDFSMVGAPMEQRGGRFAEAVTLIRRLWTEDPLTFEGVHYQCRDLSLEPKPIAAPHPPIWIGGWGPRALQRAAELGEAWIPGPTADLAKLMECQALYFGHAEALGKHRSTLARPLTREVVIAKTDDEAHHVAERHLLVNYRDEYGGGWNHPLIGRAASDAPDRLADLASNRFIIGSPDACVRQIQAFRDAFGVDHLICRLHFPGLTHDFIMNEMRLLAEEVLPAFGGRLPG